MIQVDRELALMVGSWLVVALVASFGGAWPLFAIGAAFVTWWGLRQ